MSKKGKKKPDLRGLDGVVTFFGSHHALRAEGVLKKNNFRAVLIPGPREISPNCGVALRFDYSRKDAVQQLFDDYFIHFEDVYLYPEK